MSEQTPESDVSSGSACSTQGCGCPSRWLWPVLLLAFVAAFMFSNRSRPAGPSAVAWSHDLEAALVEARESGRPVFAEFYTTWCGPCKWMDAEVFTQQSVADALEGYIAVKIDVDKNKDLARQVGVEGYPTMIIFASDGKVVDSVMGALDAEQLAEWVARKKPA